MNAHNIGAPRAPSPAAATFDPARLAAANINPVTRLATDYLNHFNEPIMLLEMLPSVPDFAADILAWRRLSYHDYFMTSHFKDRELAIAAYAVADPTARERLEALAGTMTTVLAAARDALGQNLTPAGMGELGSQVAGWLKPLVARAGAVINGEHARAARAGAAPDAPQAAVDALFGRGQ